MITCLTPLRVLLVGLVTALVAHLAPAQSVTFTPIGPATQRSIIPRDISSNGKVIVGEIELEDGLMHPFMWNSGAFTLLADPSIEGTATGISADGSVAAVTLANPSGGYIPYRWSSEFGLIALPLLWGTDPSLMTGRISRDGSTILGNGVFGYWGVGAVKWTDYEIEQIPGVFFARGISANGSVIVGDRSLVMGPVVDPYALTTEAVRWTASEGAIGLGLVEPNTNSSGWVVSGDGRVVLGNYGNSNFYWIPTLVFRWTEAVGFETIPPTSAYNVPTAVSFDGSIVLSTRSYREDRPEEALIWTNMDGSLPLKDYLEQRGLWAEVYRWRLVEARAMSPGGRYIVGYGLNGYQQHQMFLVDLGPLPPPVIETPSVLSATFGVPFKYTITATNDPDTFWAYGLSPLLSCNATSGVISGRAFTVGSFEIDLGASNSSGYDVRTVTLQVNKAPAGIEISNTVQAYTGTARSVTVTTIPGELNTVVTYNGGSAAPINPGTYQVTVEISDDFYQGSATGSLTIQPPPLPVITSSSSATAIYGTAFSYRVEATNDPQSFDAFPLPDGLSINQATGVISGQPTTAGIFEINLKASNAGGAGTAVLNLQIGKADASVAISNTSQVYTAAPRPVSVTTTPAGLNTLITYAGTTAAPSAVGSYPVNAVITDANYQGSATATLTIYTSTLQILSQPSSLTVNEGATATFTVKASGPGTLTYAWRKGSGANATVIGTGESLTIPSTTLADAGTYKVTVSNGTSSVTSTAARLTVNSVSAAVAPAITQQPASQTVTLNPKKSVSVTFSVTATGTAPLSYQWKRNGVTIPGATGSSYTISKVTISDNGAQFQVTVSNVAGTAVSTPATLTVK